ncbi:MAG: cell envelope biosis protein OmpA [Herbaspirillum sp.]|jgi:OOP family OmpA-OmpF porin|nr:cell envelope biosis protein OmpA [Herbaspirillum sp.]
MNKHLTGIMLPLLILAGCASKERFVLLPQPDGTPSSIVIRSNSGESTLSTPYASVETQGGKAGKQTMLNEAEVRERYAPVMTSLPLRPRKYLLYFSLGKDLLTPASKDLLAQAIKDFKQFPAGEFLVTGHADDLGAKRLNDELALRRAQQIQRELIRAKVDAVSIEVIGRGADDPLVPAKKGQAEPRNRYVEIKIR